MDIFEKTITKKTVKQILELSEHSLTLERNEFLKVGGSIDTNAYYIESGSLKVYVLDDFEERIIRFGYAENIIVSLDSFFTEKPSDLYIQALKKTELKVVSKEQVTRFLEADTNRRFWISELEKLIVQQHEREVDLLTNSPRERYRRVMERSPQLFQEIPNKHIASYLRMSPETLSRLKKS